MHATYAKLFKFIPSLPYPKTSGIWFPTVNSFRLFFLGIPCVCVCVCACVCVCVCVCAIELRLFGSKHVPLTYFKGHKS